MTYISKNHEYFEKLLNEVLFKLYVARSVHIEPGLNGESVDYRFPYTAYGHDHVVRIQVFTCTGENKPCSAFVSSDIGKYVIQIKHTDNPHGFECLASPIDGRGISLTTSEHKFTRNKILFEVSDDFHELAKAVNEAVDNAVMYTRRGEA